ncbi:DUF4112 domain-containing protein [Corynebacterium hansenii]|uniref:DUF4112 domain-containing protein n=1 Tax=Corynebacterium hansenii TaxID=394964 RepID=A0ABV7ZTP3_9CORY|nr:DUF4112 domain-containing protein [Corynebacterium hansenii]WJY99914.1 hypothetical protein CHAN_06500 [Corynebacterium hansenii]
MNANHPHARRNGRGRGARNSPDSAATDVAAAGGPDTSAPRTINRTSRVIAHVMDDLIAIPGTNRRIGLDPIIGLIPGVGDAAGAVATAGLLIDGVRYRVPFIVLLRMAFNLLLDMTLGAIPVVGDAFDFLFRANIRNERLMVKALEDPAGSAKSSKRYLIGAGVLLAVLAVLIVALTIGAIWGVIALIRAGY